MHQLKQSEEANSKCFFPVPVKVPYIERITSRRFPEIRDQLVGSVAIAGTTAAGTVAGDRENDRNSNDRTYPGGNTTVLIYFSSCTDCFFLKYIQ